MYQEISFFFFLDVYFSFGSVAVKGFGNIDALGGAFASHLALLLDGLLPRLPLLPALLLVARLRADAGQVRVVDAGHSLCLLGGQTSPGKNLQRDARPARHADLLRKKEKGIKAGIIRLWFPRNLIPFLVLR